MGEPRLARETFTSSRLLEFCSERELIAQTGHPVEDWPLVVIKELIDNAIDGAEEAGVAPQVSVTISRETGEIVVADNGPGIPAETVDNVRDYTVRVSSREAYVSPTRGAQGNALKTIVAMPFVLDRAAGETVIEARGIAHRIRFTVDPIRQEPRISCDRASSSVKTGTRVTVRWPTTACHLLDDDDGRFLPICWDYAALNPHLALSCRLPGGASIDWPEPTAPDWEKWRPTDQIPAHWYSAERLQRLIAACINRDRQNGKRVRLLREFVRDFRGLTGSAKLAAVLDELGLSRARLDVFVGDDKVDHAGIARLLAAMQRHSKPVKPERLGLIGREHFARLFAVDSAHPDNVRYSRELGHNGDLPFVVEAAFARIKDVSSTPLVSGINWSPAISDPFRWSVGPWAQSLRGLLRDRHIVSVTPALIGVSLATPTVSFVDRGKSAAMLTRAVGKAVETVVKKITKEWFEAYEAEQRRRRQRERSVERSIEELKKEERANERRQRATTVGTGKLHAEIAGAAAQHGVSITRLTVLSTRLDPYRRDTTDGHRDGRWFADQVALLPVDRKIHLRGLFYRVVAAGDIRRPDGSRFINDHDCWEWLQDTAAKAARWLGYVPFERIVDNRNEEPRLICYADPPRPGAGYLAAGAAATIAGCEAALPYLGGTPPVAQQPYRIILIGEKSSLGEVLEPIAQQVKGDLLLLVGESSDTKIAEMAARAAADPRPAAVLYFSDFDPSGWQMPISVSRKLQALRTLRHPDLCIAVHRVALTLNQVRELNLPSTPLKATEKRADRWRARMGHEQTEIDALAALRPEVMTRITLDALKPFFDFDLDARCRAAFEKWQAEARKKLVQHAARPEIEASIRDAYAEVETAVAALEQAQIEALKRLQDGDDGIGRIEIAVPEVKIAATPPAPLFTTDDDFETATRKLIKCKALAPDED